MRKHKSKLQQDENCFICGNPNTEEHHALHGTASRRRADKHGLIIYLCHYHHMDLHDRNTVLDRHLQRTAQRYYEENIGSRYEFIKEFGKSYL